MFMELNHQMSDYIDNLVSHYPQIQSIWLLGSRANNSYRADSDWDLMIFANHEVLTKLKENESFNQKGIDILVVFNGQDFEGPWPDDKGIKKGNLKEWEWNQKTINEANYKSVKYKSEEWFKANMLDCRILKAIKLWPA